MVRQEWIRQHVDEMKIFFTDTIYYRFWDLRMIVVFIKNRE